MENFEPKNVHRLRYLSLQSNNNLHGVTTNLFKYFAKFPVVQIIKIIPFSSSSIYEGCSLILVIDLFSPKPAFCTIRLIFGNYE